MKNQKELILETMITPWVCVWVTQFGLWGLLHIFSMKSNCQLYITAWIWGKGKLIISFFFYFFCNGTILVRGKPLWWFLNKYPNRYNTLIYLSICGICKVTVSPHPQVLVSYQLHSLSRSVRSLLQFVADGEAAAFLLLWTAFHWKYSSIYSIFLESKT